MKTMLSHKYYICIWDDSIIAPSKAADKSPTLIKKFYNTLKTRIKYLIKSVKNSCLWYSQPCPLPPKVDDPIRDVHEMFN